MFLFSASGDPKLVFLIFVFPGALRGKAGLLGIHLTHLCPCWLMGFQAGLEFSYI